LSKTLSLKSTMNPELEEVTEVKTLQSEERQTIVHCAVQEGMAYRVWPTTYLVEQPSGKKARLITAFNISFAPNWTFNDGKGFTLIFEGLSKDCRVFDLIEIIPQEGGFEVRGIARNNSDVYNVEIR